jgi:hypothetical protein
MAGSKEDTETGAFFQEHARAGSATPLLVVSDGAAGVHRAIKEQPQGRAASATVADTKTLDRRMFRTVGAMIVNS